MNAFASLLAEAEPDEKPRFFVEEPDGDRTRTELARVTAFRREMRWIAPKVKIWANANAGKRSAMQARAEGIQAGVFDYSCAWSDRWIAFPEFKGYDKRGRPGTLSVAQIRWGNTMLDLGFHVACFFRPESAIEWLRKLRAPFIDRKAL